MAIERMMEWAGCTAKVVTVEGQEVMIETGVADNGTRMAYAHSDLATKPRRVEERKAWYARIERAAKAEGFRKVGTVGCGYAIA